MKKDLLDCIGQTPLVPLRQGTGGTGGKLYAKLELWNPFGMKDRVAKQIVLDAKERGILRDAAPIIESSSGTMALGLALVGTLLGHPVHIVTDSRIDPLTLAKLQATGCYVHVVQQMNAQGWQGARLERLYELLEHYPSAFWPRQYDNPLNPLAYTEVARELLDDLERVDILVAAVGSGGSLCGTARALLKTNPHLRVVAVDAVGSVIFGQPDQAQRLQGGLGNSLIPANVDFSLIDEVHWLNDREAFMSTLELAAQEKIFAGNSSGSVYAVARWISQNVAASMNVVAIFPDRGDRYVETIYQQAYRSAHGMAELPGSISPQEIFELLPVSSWSFLKTTSTSTHALPRSR